MSSKPIARRSGLAVLAVIALCVLGPMVGQAAAYSPGRGQVPTGREPNA